LKLIIFFAFKPAAAGLFIVQRNAHQASAQNEISSLLPQAFSIIFVA